ncbi:NAD(P)-binding protein [Lentinus brumalis]|uniref:NAD(P)-binding protein n=1 Tax=Lentinus brumalis TaxID=2498619 RepID=A0A371D934_9APHY|nr:NAD(P)-binding protein [Polyporus brumalis]
MLLGLPREIECKSFRVMLMRNLLKRKCPGSSRGGAMSRGAHFTGRFNSTSPFRRTLCRRSDCLAITENMLLIQHCRKLPDRLSFEEGVTIFSPMSTVAFSLYSQKPETESLRMSPPWEDGRGKYAGKSIFISGGATQVGQFALQWARLSGFGPIITTASLHNTELLKSQGATHVLDRKLPQDTIVEQVKAIAGDLVDLSYDTVVEDDTIALTAAAVKPGGQLVVSIHGKEELVTKLTKPKGIQWMIGRGLQSTEQNKGALSGLLRKLPGLIEEGVIKPTPHEVLKGGLRAVPAGLERLRNNQVSGLRLIVHPHETQ